MKKINFLWKYEKYFFILFVLISLLPILSSKFFPTVDGPAHLHNANLLKHIWFKGNTNLLLFFDINHQLNSNLLNHIWYAVFGLFLPSFLVEKSILLFYVISLPFSFRYLIKNVVDAPQSTKTASYLIFPFIYSFTFCIGFFNFCIGIPILFWALGFWLKNKNKQNRATTIFLTCLVTLLYFSHLFNFLLFEIIMFSIVAQDVFKNKMNKGTLKQVLLPIVISLPAILLFISFLISNNKYEHSPPSYLPKAKLIETILDLSPIITLSYEKEILFSKIVFYSICLILLLAIINKIRKREGVRDSNKIIWLIPTCVVLILYFIFPDWISSGGYISIRWALFFFFMILIWIVSQALPPAQLIIPVVVILATHVFFINYHCEQTKLLSEDAEELAGAESHMEENTVLLPLNYSTNWIQINHACYMATTKAIVNLDNYEPTKPHFPLIWKKGEQVYDLMKNYGNRNPPCINIENYESHTHHHIDYISRWLFNGDNSDSCSANVAQILEKEFDLIYESPHKKLLLYKRKKQNWN